MITSNPCWALELLDAAINKTMTFSIHLNCHSTIEDSIWFSKNIGLPIHLIIDFFFQSCLILILLEDFRSYHSTV